MSGYVPAHPHPRMFYPGPYMSFPRPFMRFPPPGRPRFYSPDLYASDYHSQKERLEFVIYSNVYYYYNKFHFQECK